MSSAEVFVTPSPVVETDQVSDAPPAITEGEENPKKSIASQVTNSTTTAKTTSDSEDLSENVPESPSESGTVTTPPFEVSQSLWSFTFYLKTRVLL